MHADIQMCTYMQINTYAYSAPTKHISCMFNNIRVELEMAV